jgi:hypothetical protein
MLERYKELKILEQYLGNFDFSVLQKLQDTQTNKGAHQKEMDQLLQSLASDCSRAAPLLQ